MYVRLLEAVLSDETDPVSPDQPPAHPSVPLAEVVRLRRAMEKHANRTDPGWALQAVADQLAYDAALVRLGRRRGVVVELDGFDVPDRGRAQLERAMIEKGIRLSARTHMPDGHIPTFE
jgi:hypothetical protein